MSKVNDTFHNICIVHDVFRGRINEVIFRHLIKEREDIFTTDKLGNIIEINGFKVLNPPILGDHPTTYSLDPDGEKASHWIASDLMTSGGTLDLEDYLIGEQITELRRLSEARHLRGNIR